MGTLLVIPKDRSLETPDIFTLMARTAVSLKLTHQYSIAQGQSLDPWERENQGHGFPNPEPLGYDKAEICRKSPKPHFSWLSSWLGFSLLSSHLAQNANEPNRDCSYHSKQLPPRCAASALRRLAYEAPPATQFLGVSLFSLVFSKYEMPAIRSLLLYQQVSTCQVIQIEVLLF